MEQAEVFAAMMVCGAACGVLYDGFALARRLLRAGSVITGALDLVFCFCCSGSIIAMALFHHTDAFRLYVFLGFALGLAAYAGTIGALMRFIYRRMRKCVKKSRFLAKKFQRYAGNKKTGANI